jgi:hypothetical protein
MLAHDHHADRQKPGAAVVDPKLKSPPLKAV